jgi:CDP-diacylglycerol pyrophosphatase
MTAKRFMHVRTLLCCAIVAGCASPNPSLPPPAHPNGQVLWQIVSTQCVPGQHAHGDPAPCSLVMSGVHGGFVLLKDREGVAQYLLLPSDKITGIEDPKILAANAPNYFKEAWNARRFVSAQLPRSLSRDEVSVAVNSIYGRSQDQLHLHIDCLATSTRDALRAYGPKIGGSWSRHPIAGSGRVYWTRRIEGENLAVNPFQLLAREIPGAADHMSLWTLVLVGSTSASGQPGFYLLADRANPARGDAGSGEELQDHGCNAPIHQGDSSTDG